ncbi:hypothetical protein PFISCL1PPCAC_7526, partial [Pristionchus fissidentatus]
RFLSNFNPTRCLGQGGFGIVFEAEHLFDKRKYGVKRVHIPPNQDELTKALGEVYKMAEFEHPGIVRYHFSWQEQPPTGWQVPHFDNTDDALRRQLNILKYFENGVFIYIQMQLCNYSLEDWLAENMGNRDAETMRGWLKKLLEAVAYIHDQNIFHRDLKPGNILFDGKGEPKVCDVGIAAAFETNEEGKEKTATRTQIGSPLYKAPEQLSWIYNSKVDIFSLGLTFAEMSVPMIDPRRNQIFDNYRGGE